MFNEVCNDFFQYLRLTINVYIVVACFDVTYSHMQQTNVFRALYPTTLNCLQNYRHVYLVGTGKPFIRMCFMLYDKTISKYQFHWY